MSEEILEATSESGENTVEQDTNNYIEAIKEMKANSVSKEAYNKLKEENKQLLDSLINGKQVNITQPKEKVNVQELRNKLADVDSPLSNLEYCKAALELRNAVIEEGGKDPFLPWGHNIAPTDEDVIKANRVADVLEQCIDYADGDSELFTNELQRRTIDAMPLRRKK